jgi:hypothetical protein
MIALGVDHESPNNGLEGSHWPHLGQQPAQDAAIGAEHDKVKLHAIDGRVGFVLDDEIEPATVFDWLDGIEFDKKFSFRGKGSVLSQQLESEQRRQNDSHIVPLR